MTSLAMRVSLMVDLTASGWMTAISLSRIACWSSWTGKDVAVPASRMPVMAILMLVVSCIVGMVRVQMNLMSEEMISERCPS